MIDSKKERYLALFDAALGLQQIGEHQRALEILQEAAERAQAEDPDYALEEDDQPLVEAQLHLLMGISYQELGHLEEAEDSLRNAIWWRPEYPEALQALGLLLFARRRWPEAAELLQKHLQHEPASLLTLRVLGTALLRQRREDEAVQTFRKAWQQTEDQQVGIEAGRLLLSLGLLNEARELLQQVVEGHDSAQALTELAAALTMQGDCTRAVQALQRAIDMDPMYDRAWRGLAHCHSRLGNLERALEVAQKATSLDSRDYRNWQSQAQVLLRLSRPNEALEAIQRGIELIDPEDEEASPVLRRLFVQKTEALLKRGLLRDALTHLDVARDRFPTDELFLAQQTATLLNQGEYRSALQSLDEAQRAWNPDDSRLAPLRYWALHGMGRHEEALTIIRPYLEEHADAMLSALGAVGFSLYGHEKVSAARAVYEQLLDLAPDEPRVVNNLAFILTGEGELEKAEMLYLRALKTAQSNQFSPLSHANLGYLYLLQGEYVRAGEHLKEAVSPAKADGKAILRVAYWDGDHLLPDPVPHPTRWLPIGMAVQANQVTLALVQGQVEEAEQLAREIVTSAPETSWGHVMLGWVLRANADQKGARQAWQRALELTRNTQDQEAITAWLESMPNDS